MNKNEAWERAVSFHGHECPGLTIGYRAAIYAAKLLELTFSDDEQVVCISENDACGVDAVQAILGCSVGKGNLLFHMTGKQAFSFYNRKSGKSVRLPRRCTSRYTLLRRRCLVTADRPAWTVSAQRAKCPAARLQRCARTIRRCARASNPQINLAKGIICYRLINGQQC